VQHRKAPSFCHPCRFQSFLLNAWHSVDPSSHVWAYVQTKPTPYLSKAGSPLSYDKRMLSLTRRSRFSFFFIENEEDRECTSFERKMGTRRPRWSDFRSARWPIGIAAFGLCLLFWIRNSGSARESAGNNWKEGVHVAAASAPFLVNRAAGSASTTKERIHFR